MAKVLIVEGDNHVRENLALGLEERGHEVTRVQDGQEAIDILGSHQFDLVVTAVLMERVDGIQLLSWLETRTDRPPVIAISAGHPDIPAHMALLLAKTYTRETLEKPINEEVFFALVEKLIKDEQDKSAHSEAPRSSDLAL